MIRISTEETVGHQVRYSETGSNHEATTTTWKRTPGAARMIAVSYPRASYGSVAENFADGHNGFVYEIDGETPGGIDVNAVLGEDSPYPSEAEIAFRGGISREFIRGAYGLIGGELGGFIPNPFYEVLL